MKVLEASTKVNFISSYLQQKLVITLAVMCTKNYINYTVFFFCHTYLLYDNFTKECRKDRTSNQTPNLKRREQYNLSFNLYFMAF